MKIKLNTIGIVSVTALSAIGLSGCFNGSSNSLSAGSTAEQISVNAYAAKDERDEPVAIDDAAKLRSDISTVFGDANSEPVAVEDGDSVTWVIDKQ